MINKVEPIVSIGMPVRNGIEYIAVAISSILKQTEKNIEIIISDNNSTDGTSEYLKKIVKKDKRIRYYNQKIEIKAFDNFKFVLSKAKGNFFMWAAHDDTRSLNYIESLKNALEKNPKSILAFGDLYITSKNNEIGYKKYFPFDTSNQNIFKRLKILSFIQCYYIYGLWKTDKIKNVQYEDCIWWPDLPFMLVLACKGDFIHVPETRFNYLEIKKTARERAQYQDYKNTFNLFFEVFYFLKSCFISCKNSHGILIGLYVLILVTFKQLINIPAYIKNKFKN